MIDVSRIPDLSSIPDIEMITDRLEAIHDLSMCELAVLVGSSEYLDRAASNREQIKVIEYELIARHDLTEARKLLGDGSLTRIRLDEAEVRLAKAEYHRRQLAEASNGR